MKLAALCTLPVLALAGTLLACGNSGTSGTGGGGGSAPSACAGDPRTQVYAAGLERASADGTMKVSFVAAQPAPPQKGTNTWTVHVTDAGGKAVDGATIDVKPFMPDHNHGSSITPQVVPMGSGDYHVELLDFFMPGVWQSTLTITPAGGGAPTTVVFTFCVDG
jgi:hypothetical protein